MSELTHVAIIMDGNGRWAKKRGLPRFQGHRKGLEVAEQIIDHALQTGTKYISLYVFSTENWNRPQKEVNSLFGLAEKYLGRFEKFCKDKARVVVSGEMQGLPQSLVDKIADIQLKTKDFDAICINLCINYGGQNEIVHAVNKIIDKGESISVRNITDNLYQPFIPAPDLIIRTGGQKRLSNYLLFQSAYAELYFSNTLWPDFSCDEYDEILVDYHRRARNFGGIIDDE